VVDVEQHLTIFQLSSVVDSIEIFYDGLSTETVLRGDQVKLYYQNCK